MGLSLLDSTVLNLKLELPSLLEGEILLAETLIGATSHPISELLKSGSAKWPESTGYWSENMACNAGTFGQL